MTKTNSKVIALFVADLHLSATPPPYRSAEPDWFAAMLRPITELKQLQEKHNCPIFCAGDLFDKWYGGPKEHSCELINFAMTHLPYMHCIPGQHDLPEHDLGQIERSAYWTLVKASVIHDISKQPYSSEENRMQVIGFPFGSEIYRYTIPKVQRRFYGLNMVIALIHQYNWVPTAVYKQDAPMDQHVDSSRKEFNGYNLVVSGDNHIPFETIGKPHFINCGGFMIRKSDDVWRPKVWILYSDGRVEPHFLNTSKDRYLDTEDVKRIEKHPEDFDLSELFNSLGKLGTDVIDVRQAFLRTFREEPSRRTKLLLKAMET